MICIAAMLALSPAGPGAALFGQATREVRVLEIDDKFPRLTGDALSGRRIDIPAGEAQTPTVIVFSFSKAGGDDARLWVERFDRDIDLARRPDIVLVLEMQGVPRWIRGPIVFGIKRGVPPHVRDRMLVLDRDETEWKQRLSVTTTDRGYVVLIAPDGRIRWMGTRPYSENEYELLRTTVRG